MCWVVVVGGGWVGVGCWLEAGCVLELDLGRARIFVGPPPRRPRACAETSADTHTHTHTHARTHTHTHTHTHAHTLTHPPAHPTARPPRFARLWELDPAEMWGYVTNCGTEGNLHGILVGREVGGGCVGGARFGIGMC